MAWAALGLLLVGAAQPREESADGPVPRTILCVYNGMHHALPRYAEWWQYAQLILDHLGFVCRPHDLRKGLPSGEAMRGVRGILYWMHDPWMPEAAEFCRWLAGQVRKGRRLGLILKGRFAGGENPGAVEAAFGDLLGVLGIEYGGALPGKTSEIEVVGKSGWVEYERKLDRIMPVRAVYRSVGKGNRAHLRVKRKDGKGGVLDVVVTGPNGAFGYAPFVLYFNPELELAQWRVNPFRFFEAAFGRIPRFDLTTRFGRRIYFSHVDGDGFANMVLDGTEGEISAQRFRREFLERVPLPVTVSVIAYDMERSERNRRIAREIFALGNVEPAVHSYAHPLDWRKGTLSYRIEGYTFDVERETRGAVEIVRKLAGEAPVFLWSGIRNPPERAIELLDGIGVRNLNGDDSYFDGAHPSVTSVKPAYLWVGSRVQFNARASMEFLYTDHWTKHFWAFRKVIETFERTGAPVRVCPVNLYHHFYICERKAGREALREIYEWVLKQRVHALFASEYVKVVEGFLSGRLEREGSGRVWVVSDYGACRTLRFDGESREVDLEASEGVSGYAREGDTVYVHLAPGRARVVLAEAGASGGCRPYVREASGEAKLERGEGGQLLLEVASRGPIGWRLGGLKPGSVWGVAWRSVQGGIGREGRIGPLQASADGVIGVDLPCPGRCVFTLTPR